MASAANEYAGVLLFGNHYVAVHSKTGARSFISNHPEQDKEIARAAARAFAEQHNIPLRNSLLYLDKPIVTIWKMGSLWAPLLIGSTELIPVQGYEGNSDQETVIKLAQQIARIIESDCLPNIGISACTTS